MMEDGYKTLRETGSDSFIIKKSRFIGYGSPVRTEQDALGFLASIRSAHKDASHHCYAYIIGRNGGIMRYSDDGEPGGTAGMPILESIRVRGVVDCCIVVVRYFGGVLLGAGGLARAYAQGARTALDAAHVVVMEDSIRFWAGMDYALWGRVEHALLSLPVLTEGVEFAATVTATLVARQRDKEAVFATLTRVTDGTVALLETDAFSMGWEEA